MKNLKKATYTESQKALIKKLLRIAKPVTAKPSR